MPDTNLKSDTPPGIYALVGLSGIALLVSYFYICPACRKIKA